MQPVGSKIRFLLIAVTALVVGLLISIGDARADCSTDPSTFNVVSHDLANSYCELCGVGQIRVNVSNPDSQNLTNISVTEDLSASGLEYVPGSTIFNGSPAADPTIVGSVLTWTPAEIPGLNTLAGGATHLIVFQVRATSAGTEEDLVTASRLINASVSFDFQECFGNPAWPRTTDSTGAQVLALREPKIGRAHV